MVKKRNGFTIIEVVLVLAIAGLIFLMVFVALPQLQRNQRDAQRRSDMARVATALSQYQANNGGKIPLQDGGNCAGSSLKNLNPSTYNGTNVICRFIATYLNSSSSTTNEFKDPDGTPYNIYVVYSTHSGEYNVGPHNIGIQFYTKCGEEGKMKRVNNKNSFSIHYTLEGSGKYCVDNQ